MKEAASLRVVPIDTSPAIADPAGLEKRRHDEFWDVVRSMQLDEDRFFQLMRYPDFLKNRVHRLQADIRRFLAADILSDEDRQRALRAVYGKKGWARDAKALGAAEIRLIQQYRSLDDQTRTAMRTLIERLSETGVSEGGAR